MTDHPVLSTERLDMRPPEDADLGAYRAFYAVSDVKVGGYRGGRTDEEA